MPIKPSWEERRQKALEIIKNKRERIKERSLNFKTDS